MKTFVFRIAFWAAAAVATVNADDSTTSSVACAAQNILDTCLATTESYVSLCATTDYMCLCDKYVAIMTCFNNCPNDSRGPSYQQQKDLYCMNASLYATTSGNRTVSRSYTPSTSSATTTTSSDASAKSGDATTGESSAGPEQTKSGNGAEDQRVGNAGGMVAALAGLIAALL